MAEKYDRNVFLTAGDTSEFQADLITSLRTHLAPRITTHGVLVEIYATTLHYAPCHTDAERHDEGDCNRPCRHAT